jgi:hypothetical protein
LTNFTVDAVLALDLAVELAERFRQPVSVPPTVRKYRG